VANILSSNRFLAVQIYSTTEEIRFATDGLAQRNVNVRKKNSSRPKASSTRKREFNISVKLIHKHRNLNIIHIFPKPGLMHEEYYA
jgi:hypothetical protein